MSRIPLSSLMPIVVGAGMLVLFGLWLLQSPPTRVEPRGDEAGADVGAAEDVGKDKGKNPVLEGKRTTGPGEPGRAMGTWPWFRGARRDGISREATEPRKSWDSEGPRLLWKVEVGDGYAGPAVRDGRVYVMDYNVEKRRDALRCLSLANGDEIWRYSYPIEVKQNHGMSRTVPAVTDNYAVAIGPKGQVTCADAKTGKLEWTIDLVRDHGARIPSWYAGQCPLIDGERLILAPGGPEALLMAVKLKTGEILWKTPNPDGWTMSHSSVVPGRLGDKRTYRYCAREGVVGVDAKTGELLWRTDKWRINIATIASPVSCGDGRLFLSGGYESGSMMLQLEQQQQKKEEQKEEGVTPKIEYRLKPKTFGATQHTPIQWNGYLYGVRPDGQFVCLDPKGKIVWTSGRDRTFGLGPFLLSETGSSSGVLYVLSESGYLSLIEASPDGFKEWGRAEVIPEANQAWGPMALVDGRLIVRDFTRMLCLDVGSS